MRRLHLLLLLASLASLTACASRSQGTLLTHTPATLPSVPRHPTAKIALPAVADVRPPLEHQGQSIQVKLFVFFVVGAHIDQRGNYVTDDYVATPHATDETRELVASALTTQGVASQIVADGPADFELRLEIEHLYATHYDANRVTVVVTRQSQGAGVDTRRYAPYGNAILHATLVDHRGGASNVVWSAHVSGFGQGSANDPRLPTCQHALQEAMADAVRSLSGQLGAALDRLGAGPAGPHAVIAQNSPLPGAFIIERMSRYRDFLERVTVETGSGRVLGHLIVDAPDRYSSRPGDWVLSRTTADDVALSAEGYDGYARALAQRYDLRRVDDASHYHFFGVLGTEPPPAK
jgi:hypothetical protein